MPSRVLAACGTWRRVRRHAARDRLARVPQHVDEGRAQPLGVGGERCAPAKPRSSSEGGALVAGQAGGGRVPAHRVQVGGLDLEARRTGEVEDVAHDAIEPRHLVVDVERPPRRDLRASPPGWRRPRSEALMIMRGLRTSWAITVDSRPRAERRSFCGGLALEAHHRVEEGVEGRGQHARVLVVGGPFRRGSCA